MAASKKTRQAVSLGLLGLALLLVFFSFGFLGNGGSGGGGDDDGGRLYASGSRGVSGISTNRSAGGATAVPTPVPSVGITDSGAIILPVAPEDEGVVITIQPSPTPGKPIAAAPAVPGLPIVVGLRDGQILSPEAIRVGVQKFEVVNQHDQPHRFAVVQVESLADAPRSADGTLDEAALGSALLGVTEPIDPARSVVLEVDLAPGPHLLVSNVLVADEPAVDAGFSFPVVVLGAEATDGG